MTGEEFSKHWTITDEKTDRKKNENAPVFDPLVNDFALEIHFHTPFTNLGYFIMNIPTSQ